jgi:hypothetical protein
VKRALRHWRERKAYTLDDAARTLGLSRCMVGYYEKGRSSDPARRCIGDPSARYGLGAVNAHDNSTKRTQLPLTEAATNAGNFCEGQLSGTSENHSGRSPNSCAIMIRYPSGSCTKISR